MEEEEELGSKLRRLLICYPSFCIQEERLQFIKERSLLKEIGRFTVLGAYSWYVHVHDLCRSTREREIHLNKTRKRFF